MQQKMSEGGAAMSLKGLRLLTIDRSSDGYGFHMYTNKELKGQYIKWVLPNGPADLAGLLPGDHVLDVDGTNVVEEVHHKVVECIRSGSGKGKKVLVVDQDTEREMREKGEEMSGAKAIVMIPRSPVQTEVKTAPQKPTPPQPKKTKSPQASAASEETDGGLVSPSGRQSSFGSAQKRSERVKVKQRDWRSSIETYNAL